MIDRDNVILYVSYDGLLDPLGKSQIIPYLKGLSQEGVKYIALSFEKGPYSLNNHAISKVKKDLDSFGIIWRRLRYHKNPSGLATFFDVFYGALISCLLVIKYRVKIVHARSYVASLIGIFLKKICRRKFIFDMRGFWADERVEAGIWKHNSWFYKIAKYFEKIFLLNADVIISLTEAAKEEIGSYSYLKGKSPDIVSIPTCVDLDRFNYGETRDLEICRKLKGKFVLVYSGSISTWFMPRQMIEFFGLMAQDIPDAHFLVLTREGEFFIKILERLGINNNNVSVVSVDYESVSDYLSLARAGLAFYKNGYSRKGCCPTKIGEYLACGLPVIINSGVGDTEGLLKEEQIGIIVSEFSKAEYERAIYQLKELLSDDGLRSKCRKVAEERFSLKSGIEKYRQTYRRLLEI